MQLVLPALKREAIGLKRLDARGVEGDLKSVVRDDVTELLAQPGHAHAWRDLSEKARGELRRILARVVEHSAQKLTVTYRVADEFGPELAVVRLDKLDRAPRVAQLAKQQAESIARLAHSAEDVLNHLLTDLEDQGYSSLSKTPCLIKTQPKPV